MGHRPRRIRRPRLLRVRNARAELRARRLRAGDQHRSRQSRVDRPLRSRVLRTGGTCAKACRALERRRRLVADRDRRRDHRAGVSRRQSLRRELDPGGPNNYSNAKAVGRRDDGANGDRLVAGSADADAVHGGCAWRQRRNAAVGSRERADSRLRRLRRAQSRRRRLDDDGDGGSRDRSTLHRQRVVRQSVGPRRRDEPRGVRERGVNAASDTPSIAPRRDRAGCPSPD